MIVCIIFKLKRSYSMSLLILVIGIVLFLVGAYLQHEDKSSIAAWVFMGIGGMLWVTAIYA
jgi:hypothetical protein